MPEQGIETELPKPIKWRMLAMAAGLVLSSCSQFIPDDNPTIAAPEFASVPTTTILEIPTTISLPPETTTTVTTEAPAKPKPDPKRLTELLTGQAELVEVKDFSATGAGNSETSTIYYNGEYLMFHRTYLLPDGSACPFTTGIAMSKSNDGIHYEVQNGGQPLSGLNSIPERTCPGGNLTDTIYAPNVIIPPSGAEGELWMAVERRSENRAEWYAGHAHHPYLHRIDIFRSIDGGQTWGSGRTIQMPNTEDMHDPKAEIGTPSLFFNDGQVFLSSHTISYESLNKRNGFHRALAVSKSTKYETLDFQIVNQDFLPKEPGTFGPGAASVYHVSVDGKLYMAYEEFINDTNGLCRPETQIRIKMAELVFQADGLPTVSATTTLSTANSDQNCINSMPSLGYWVSGNESQPVLYTASNLPNVSPKLYRTDKLGPPNK
jgi:hypothetical protein